MPVFQVDLQDGRSFEIESDVPPSEQDVLAALGGGVGFDNRTRQPIPSDAAESPMSFMDKILANPVLGAVTEFAADVPANLVNTPGYLVNKASQAVGGNPLVYQVSRGESMLPEVFPSLEKMAATPIAFPPDALSPFADTTPAAQPMPKTAGVVKGLEDVTRGLVTPETALSLGAVKSPDLGRALATLFGVTSAAHLPQASAEVGRLSVEGTPAETARAALNTLAQAAIAGHVATGGALGMNKAYQERPITPEVVGAREPFVAPTERQITLPEQLGEVIDLEPIKTGDGTMYKAAGDVQKQIEGPKRQFVGDALGRVIPAEKVNPLGMDVRKPGVGSEPYWTVDPKKPFTETPPTVGEQSLAVELAGFPAIAGKLNELAERIKRAELVIQPAYQAAGTKDPESQLPTQEITKLSPSSPAAGRPGSAFREPVVQTQQGMYNLPEKTTSAVAPSKGSVGDMALSPYDAASLPQPAKMISGEGQSSTQSEKAPQIEDAKSTTNLGGAEKDLPLEQRKISQKNNSMEAFAKANDVEYVPGDTAKTILERVNKKKQSGSTTESDSGEGYGRRMYGGIFFLDPKFWSDNFGKNSHVQMDGKQLYNRIRNKLNENSKTWKNMDTEALREFVLGKEKISAKDVADFVARQENEQRKGLVKEQEKWWEGVKGEVEVRKFQKYDADKEASRLSQLEHELDTANIYAIYDDNGGIASWRHNGKTVKAEDMQSPHAQKMLEMERMYGGLQRKDGEVTHWQQVAPKPESEMKDYVEIAVVRPVKSDRPKTNSSNVPRSEWTREPGELFPSSHNFPPNTLGFVRGYMEGDTFHVIEVQSDWAQSLRKDEQDLASGRIDLAGATPRAREQFLARQKEKNDPLINHYERLALKAAIEHARAAGAKRIAIQDAESAMLMEGHDQAASHVEKKYLTEKDAREAAFQIQGKADISKKNHQSKVINDEGTWKVIIPKRDWEAFGGVDSLRSDGWRLEREGGMQMHYSTSLPKILSELTGSKGEKVNFGEHKMAIEPRWDGVGEKKARKDLIFRNPDGTPKTDITARSYPIPEIPVDQPAVKGIGAGIQSAIEKNKQAGSIPNLFYRKNRPIKSSEFQYVLKFKPYDQEVAEATTPRGLGKWLKPVGKAAETLENTDALGIKNVGALLSMVAGTDPRSIASNPVAKAIIANAVQYQKGQNYAALWQESQRDVQRAFELDDSGRVTLANGSKAYMGDVIEAELRNPGSQPLTLGQKNFVREWKDLRNQIVQYAQSQGVRGFVDEDGNIVPLSEAYFPRPAVGKEGIKDTVKDSVRKQVGGKQFFAKERFYETEAEGARAGIKYDPDEYSRIGRWMNAVYKAIADSRMANDPALGGRSVKFGRPKFLEEGMVFQPAFSGRVFDKATADHLNRYYGETTHAWVKSLANINDFLKAFQFSVDVSAPLNQGLPLMSMRPHRWAKATVKSYAALADDRILNKYIQDPVNQRIAREIVENGGSLVRLQDFLAGAEQGKMAGKIAPIRASARSMGTFLSIAKIEMYKAMEPLMKPGDTKADLVEAVENAVLSGKMEGIGLQQGRALGERLLFNAPSYIRAAFNNVAAAGQGKITGRVARRVLIGMATAISLQMYALYKLSGMSDDEITKRFTPTNSEFLRYPYQMSDGRMKEISYGNILIGMARLAGDSVNYLDGTKTLGSGDKNNPWLRWISYRESPVGNLLFELKTGEDYRGEDLSAKQAIAKSMLPVSLSPLAEKGTREGKTIGVLAQGLGLSAYDESAGAFKSRKQNELAQSKYGKKYEELTAAQRRQVTGPAEVATDALGEKTTPRMILNVEKRQAERKKQLIEDLTPAAQGWLATNKLDVSGWSLKTSVKKKEITLANQAEREKLQELMTQHTQEMLDRMMRTGRKYSQDDVNQRLEMAHKRAWRDMKHLMGNPDSE